MFRNDVVAISPAFPYSAIIESRQSLKKTVESDSKHRKKEKFQKFNSIRQEKRLFDLSKCKSEISERTKIFYSSVLLKLFVVFTHSIKFLI